MSTTLHISISFEHEPIELDVLSDKLTWSTLITLIGTLRSIETPITLYYKKDAGAEIETLQSQDQLAQLLIPDIKGLQFYTQKELVTKPVHILPANSFVTLAEFVDKNKSVIASSHRLSRSVGMLAFFIAQDTTESKFDHEFEVLENLVTRYLARSKIHEKKQPEESSDEQDYYPDLRLDERCRIGGRGGRHHFDRLFSGRGDHHFGGRGDHHFGGRGGHHFGGRGGFGDFGDFSGPGGPGGPFRGYGGPFGGHGKHFGGRYGPFDSFNDRPFGGKGKRFGKGKRGRCGRAFSDTEEFDSGRVDPLAQRFYGGKREKSVRCRHFELSSEDSSSEEERRAREKYFLKKVQRKCFAPEERLFA